MKNILSLLFVFALTGQVLALPRFAMMEDVSCGSCHSYQGGGAGRTSYGKEYVNESLVSKDIPLPWVYEENDFPAYFGIDTRYQMITSPGNEMRKFPMQFALYAGAELGNVIAHAEINRVIDEFKLSGGIRYEGLPLESWVSFAKELPILGWRIDDHTVFTRGGNLSTLGLDREGMPYTPFIDSPFLVEVGSIPLSGLDLSVMAGTGFITASDSATFSAAKIAYGYSGDLFVGRVGYAYLQEGELAASVATWGLGVNKFVWLGELSQMNDWPRTGQNNYAAMQQLSYRLFQGIDVIARYEFFDPELDLLTGAIQRTTLGVELFPFPGLEVKMSYRSSQLEFPSSTPDAENQFLAQFHFYI